jgi:hypothetical protein
MLQTVAPGRKRSKSRFVKAHLSLDLPHTVGVKSFTPAAA